MYEPIDGHLGHSHEFCNFCDGQIDSVIFGGHWSSLSAPHAMQASPPASRRMGITRDHYNVKQVACGHRGGKYDVCHPLLTIVTRPFAAPPHPR